MLSIGLASKGRIQDQTFAFLDKIGLPIKKTGTGRSYAAEMSGIGDVKVWLLPADEIAKRLHAGKLHAGVTGLDLIHENGDPEGRVAPLEPLGFARADLIVGVPQSWIDVSDTAELLEVFSDLRARQDRAPRVATKYINITKQAFAGLGIRDFRLVADPGATEAAPAREIADVIVDITTSGETLRANHLKPLMPPIMRSQAFLAASLAPDIWEEASLSALEQVMDRIASHGDKHKFIRFSAPANAKALSNTLKARFGLEIEHSVKGGEASLYASGDVAFDVAAFLQAETGKTVSVFDPAYRLERPNPKFAEFRAQLSH
ncbi:MAG: ATP phosphoribosyltransferase [Pseudomonadota bacterium]